MTIKYQRQIIGVERKLGFIYIPASAQELMPEKTGKVNVLLEGSKKARHFSYNSDYKRIFGLTLFYKQNNIEVGTVLDIVLSDQLMKISVAKNNINTKKGGLKDNSLDISGLSSSAKGNIVEDRVKELVLLYGQGLINVYKPVVDERGIDLIVMRDGVFTPIFLQIKSRYNVHKNDTLLIDIRDKTFNPHHSFYIVALSFNPVSLEVDNKILFMPSEEIAKIKISNGVHRVSVSVKEQSKGQYAGFLINKSDLVEKLMEKFEEMAKYIK